MQKHLFPSMWIFAALIAGILICLIAIAWMLLRPPVTQSQLREGAYFVREVLHHATT